MLTMMVTLAYLLMWLSFASSCATQRDTCPWNWPGNPLSCDLVLCQRTSDCTREGKTGICCQTTCGGQNCHFQSIRINRNAAVCPPLSWNGESIQLCSVEARKDTCSNDGHCVKNKTRGYCCATRCGAQACYFPTLSDEYCPASWDGEFASVCNQNLCHIDNDCIRTNGVHGHCCMTKCMGRHCRYPPGPSVQQLAEKIFDPAAENGCPAPRSWPGVNATSCLEKQCSRNESCEINGTAGYCCPTECGGMNCYVNRIKRSTELDCDPDKEICDEQEHRMHRRSTQESACPADWMGILGSCARHQCANGSKCTRSEQDGFCCPTKCGGFNCYIDSNPDPLNHTLDRFCPKSWRGSNASLCGEHLCNKSTECSDNGVEGHCCLTACGGTSCRFLPSIVMDNRLSGRVRPIYPQCPNPLIWPGMQPSRCKVRQCTRNNQCWSWSDGIVGLCCPTKCGGGYSCYDPTRPLNTAVNFGVGQIGDDADALNNTMSSVCPRNWMGVFGMCGRHICEKDTHCIKKGSLKDGVCCPTKCGGHNCHFPEAVLNKTKREIPSENSNVGIRQARSFGLQCPWNWYGQIGRCRQNVCAESEDCPGFNGRYGLCCRTKCGANNCYYHLYG